MADTLKVLGFAGSLRKSSFNKSLLRAAVELAPPGMTLETFDLDGIPLFNQDLEGNMPAKVKDFKARIRQADAVLIVTPEYNYSIPGVLKNAIDCATRPYGDNPFDGKPVAILGASVGQLGSARAQYHLRQCCTYLNMYPLNRPEVLVGSADKKFDAEGKLTDPKTREMVGELLKALAAWTLRLKD
jgi:chromate reductase, NAD(P)H dehydrogenase (quinone)